MTITSDVPARRQPAAPDTVRHGSQPAALGAPRAAGAAGRDRRAVPVGPRLAPGWANNFYAAAVQAGTQSWKALFFGSLDAGNAITVDKPPASLWVMALVRPALRLQRVDACWCRRR